MTVAETMIAIITYIPIDNDGSLLYHNSNYIVLTDMLVSYYEVRYSFITFWRVIGIRSCTIPGDC